MHISISQLLPIPSSCFKMQRENKTEAEINCRKDTDCTNENLKAENVANGSQNTQMNQSILENQTLFYEKLGEFHESAGLSFVASYAKTVLDLFMLYTEVTKRGGFEQVTRDGRWSDVAHALDFTNESSTPSFLLKDLYRNLLFQFELIHFSGLQGNLSMPPGSDLAPTSSKNTFIDHSSNNGDSTGAKGKYQCSPSESSKASFHPGNQVGNTVVGEVETEFDSGYLIKVAVGSENLNGVLYQQKDSSVEQFASVPSLTDGVGLEDSDSEPVGLQVRVGSAKQETEVRSSAKTEPKARGNLGPVLKKEVKKKKGTPKSNMGSKPKKELKRDQEAPQRPKSAYQVFMCKECDRIKKANKNARNVRQLVIDAWKSLSESDREPYIEESRKDRTRFDQEMAAYKERNNTQNHNAEHKTLKDESSSQNIPKYSYVEVQMSDTEKVMLPGGRMVDFAELMESARKLDASMHLEWDDDFLSAP